MPSPSETWRASSVLPVPGSPLIRSGRSSAIAYTTAKGGVTNLTKSMAIQLAPHNIRVVLAVPNKIGSPVGKDEFDPDRPTPNLRQNRAGTPMDMAKVLLFLASEDADFISGTAVFVDGGVSALMPGDAGFNLGGVTGTEP